MDSIKGYKTFIFNLMMAMAMLTTVWTGVSVQDEVHVIKENSEILIQCLIAIWGAGSVWLRAVTDSPIFKK